VTLEADILFSIVATETDAVDYAKDVRTTKVENFTKLTDGTGNNQAQFAWSDSRTVAFGEYDTINTSELTDERGTLIVQTIKLIYIKNTGTGEIVFPALGADPWSAIAKTDDGYPQSFALPSGTTAIFLRPAASGLSGGTITAYAVSGAISYDIFIIARGTIT
jgi:hypothetical protein